MGRAHARLSLLGAAVASVLALAGCASAVNSGANGQPTAAAPVRGGIVKIAAAADAQPAFVMANRAGNWSRCARFSNAGTLAAASTRCASNDVD